MSLTETAEHAIWKVAAYASEDSIHRLLLTGCRGLIAKLTTAPILNVEFRPGKKLELSSLNSIFTNLRELRVACTHLGYTLRGFGEDVKACKPMEKLRSLELDFSRSVLLLKAVPSLPSTFPNLESLSLHSNSRLLRDLFRMGEWRSVLPPKLKRFTVSALPDPPCTWVLYPSDIAGFPRTLEELDVPSFQIFIDPKKEEQIAWPPKLTSLTCKLSTISEVALLPKSLKHMALILVSYSPSEPLKTSELPADSERVRLLGSEYRLVCDGVWPRNLRQFRGSLDVNLADGKCATFLNLNLPKSLELFEPEWCTTTASKAGSGPPWWSILDTLREFYPNLTSLNCGTPAPDGELRLAPDALPLGLTELDLCSRAVQTLAGLSSTLSTIRGLRTNNPAVLAEIPRQTRHLFFSDTERKPYLAPEHIALLPALVSMSFDMAILKSSACFAALPKSLERLFLQATEMFFPDLGAHLPIGLVYLTVVNQFRVNPWETWITDYCKRGPTKLSHLDFNCGSAPCINPDCLSMLPQSLRSLRIADWRPNKPSLTSLPRMLETLILCAATDSERLTDSLFGRLPQSLTEIQFPHGDGYTANLVDLIPRDIGYISFESEIPSDLFQAVQEYYQDSKWEQANRLPQMEEWTEYYPDCEEDPDYEDYADESIL